MSRHMTPSGEGPGPKEERSSQEVPKVDQDQHDKGGADRPLLHHEELRERIQGNQQRRETEAVETNGDQQQHREPMTRNWNN